MLVKSPSFWRCCISGLVGHSVDYFHATFTVPYIVLMCVQSSQGSCSWTTCEIALNLTCTQGLWCFFTWSANRPPSLKESLIHACICGHPPDLEHLSHFFSYFLFYLKLDNPSVAFAVLDFMQVCACFGEHWPPHRVIWKMQCWTPAWYLTLLLDLESWFRSPSTLVIYLYSLSFNKRRVLW